MRVHLMQSRDRDPMVDGARYTYAVKAVAGAEILASVSVAPICVHLLPLSERLRLEARARELVQGAAASLADGDEIRVGSDGAVRLGNRLLDRWLRLEASA